MKKNLKKNIVLTGFMGVGKSTVGKKLSTMLRMRFVDTDYMIERNERMSIPKIFSSKGEAYFRDIESKMVVKASKYNNAVISTGGGVVVREENINYLRKNGIIVHLTANIETILCHTSKNKKRPLLQHDNVEERIQQILQDRGEFYKNNDYEIDVSDLSVAEVCNEIIHFYKGSEK